MCENIDFKKSLDSYQARRGSFRMVDVPTMQYLMIDCAGDPNSAPRYAQALETLYPVAYAIKFSSQRELERDYVVPPLEGLWRAEDVTVFTSARDKSQWRWIMMIMTPEWIGPSFFEAALRSAKDKAPSTGLDVIRFSTLSEGRCVQTLHVGPYENEGPVLQELHPEFIPAVLNPLESITKYTFRTHGERRQRNCEHCSASQSASVAILPSIYQRFVT